MKALVLCGGFPQIAAIKELKNRGITTLLADMNEKVPAVDYADEFYKVSVLDIDAIKKLAVEQKVDFLISVCADQVLQVVAQVSEELGLPCYIDFKTAENVSKKSYMKRIFKENGVPTSKFAVMKELDFEEISELKFPIIVKPVDSYSSRGVCKVNTIEELPEAFNNALNISRSKDVIVEEFVDGEEISVDVYVENGIAHVLCLTNLYKIGEDGKFVINRSFIPAKVSDNVVEQIKQSAQKIADAFNLKNTPMLIQLLTDGENISIVEFCARTGGGVKYAMIKKVSGFDVVKAVIDLTLGLKPHVEQIAELKTYMLNEFVYCNEGTIEKVEGFQQLLEDGIITDYKQFKPAGMHFGKINGSGDRLAYFNIESESVEELAQKHAIANERIKAISTEGEDLIRHDLIAKYHN